MSTGVSQRLWGGGAGTVVLGVLSLGFVFSVATGRLGGAQTPLATANGEALGITVSGHAETMAAPDIAYVSLGVVTRHKNARQASEQNAKIAQAVTAAMKREEIAEKDIQTTDFSTQPWVEYTSNGSEKLRGYRVGNTVRVTLRDIKKVGEIIDAGLTAGANTVNGIRYSIQDQEGLRQRILADAVENARHKAEAVAKRLGVSAGEPLSVSEETAYGGSLGFAVAGEPPARKAYHAETPISPGRLKASQDVSVTFAIRR